MVRWRRLMAAKADARKGLPRLAKMDTRFNLNRGEDSYRMRVMCAWCGKHLSGEGSAVSHGICAACARRFESRLLSRWPTPAKLPARRRRPAHAPTLPLPGF